MKGIHKGWIILTVIVLTVLACLGLGRFSIGVILPFMMDGLSFNYREIGLIASSVFLGYLVSVTIVGYFVMMFAAKRVIVISLLIISFGMVLSANVEGFWMAYFSCFIIGVGSGGAYVPALGLVGQWFTASRKGMAMGLAMCGSGLGIVFSGFVVPVLVTVDSNSGWRFSWYMLAVIVILIAIINMIILRNKPEDVGLAPIGTKDQNHVKTSSQNSKKVDKLEVYKNKLIWMIGLIYMSWGFSYLIFSTFLVDYLMSDVGFQEEMAGQFFAVAGIASIISGFIWGSVSDQLGRMFSLSIVYIIQFFMLLALSFTTNHVLVLIEVIIYGATLWGVPTVMNASVGDFIRPVYVPVAMGFITLFFSLGQFISPIVSGFLIDMTSNYFSAFILSAGINLLGGVGCIILHLKQNKKENEILEVKREFY